MSHAGAPIADAARTQAALLFNAIFLPVSVGDVLREHNPPEDCSKPHTRAEQKPVHRLRSLPV